MADGDQKQQPPRYWFPYWSGAPQPPPPVRPQLSRRLSPPAAPSSPRRPSPSHPRQPTAPATRGAAPLTPPHAAQSQASSRPSPSRASPLVPIREPPPPPNSNSNAGGAAAAPPPKPIALPSAPKPKDVNVVPQPEKTAVHPTASAETKHGKAAEHKPHHHKEADKEKKDEHKSKDKEQEKKHHAGEDSKHKEKEKEKKHHADAGDESKHGKDKEKDKKHHAGEDGKHKEKEKKHHADAGEDGKHGKEKEKEKKHHADAGEDGKHKEKEKEKHHHAYSGEESKHGKEAKAEHGKLHGQIKAGVADMVHRATGSGHGQGHPAASVITLAGENKGASMKVGGKSKDGWKEHHGGHLLDGGAVDGKPDGQKKQGMMTALINSNVQVINNSLLLQSSCSGGDPGVHLKLSAKSATKEKQKHAAGADKAAAAKK